MRRIATLGLLAAAFCLTFGCSKSDDKAEAPAESAAPAAPNTIVAQFLEAVRTGNDKVAESMLTDLARKKTGEMDLAVAPPGSPTATFEVGETEITEQGQLAYVESRWTDVGANGKPEISEFVWALRLDSAGWRIGGVATQPYPNMPFLQLDFENPEDMIKQTQLAEQEFQRRLNGGAAATGTTAQSTGGAPGAMPGTAPATVGNPPLGAAPLPGTTPTLNNLPAATPTLPGALTTGTVQNAGGFPQSGTGGSVQPASGFSSENGQTVPSAVQAQQPQLHGAVNR